MVMAEFSLEMGNQGRPGNTSVSSPGGELFFRCCKHFRHNRGLIKNSREELMEQGKSCYWLILGLLLVLGCAAPEQGAPTTLTNQVPGTGMLTGEVTAPSAFQAARVYAKNVDKNIIYMVYTGGGHYQTVAMLPGSYEVWVEKPGFESDPETIQVEAGGDLNIDFSLREVSAQAVGQGTFMGLDRGGRAKDALLLSYEDLYPDDPIKPVFEQNCIQCHGKSFLTFFHKSAEEWDKTLGAMLETRIPPDTVDADQRKDLVRYLSSHFGPDSPDRRMKLDVEIPLDEEALSKAQYVEYILPLDEARPRRWLQEVHLDFEGHVWYTERTLPHAVGRLDPRTGEVTDFELPDPEGDPHGLTVDSEGYVYWAEVDKGHLGQLDPKTGIMERYPYDASGTEGFLGGHTPVLDAQENVWFTLIYGDVGP